MKIWFDHGHDKVVLVGQAPSKDTEGRSPFSGRSGKRIAELMDIPHNELAHHFALANILDYWPGKHGKGDAFPLSDALAKGKRAREHLRDRRVVAFGASVVKVLGYEITDDLMLQFAARAIGRTGSMLLAFVPHPSGINRWWNDPQNTRRARTFLHRVARW